MNDTLLVTIGGLLGALITAVFNYFAARQSAKTKQEHAANLMQTYLKISEITADQLEESINQVWKVTTENLEMKHELSELRAHRATRDEQLEALEAHQAAMLEQINKDTEERQALRRIVEEKDKIINEVRSYMRGLLDWFEQRNITDFPIPGDNLLDTHSKIRLRNKRKR